jgi:hypothetical protein
MLPGLVISYSTIYDHQSTTRDMLTYDKAGSSLVSQNFVITCALVMIP